ncbi:hypothetical protein LJR066_006669 [Acidovorax sp. LjRoot66]|uniref:hypothetical protein n=1 Tax=Acidovorax sp. LjRoot66 TaxID=3342334 RepID=UPI003ECF8470
MKTKVGVSMLLATLVASVGTGVSAVGTGAATAPSNLPIDVVTKVWTDANYRSALQAARTDESDQLNQSWTISSPTKSALGCSV